MLVQTTFSDPGRLYLLIYGKPKVGKTRSVLDMVKEHRHYMVMISTDRGDLYVRKHPKLFEGHLAILHPRNLDKTREAFAEAAKRVNRLRKKGVPPNKIWLVVDHATSLQQRLMKEARMVQVTGSSKSGRGQRQNQYEREMTTDVDYGVNLGHMVEIADVLDTVDCNIVVICLEKDEYTGGKDRSTTGRQIVDMSGQPARRFTGDADAILQMVRDKHGTPFFKIAGTGSGGDRSGNLADSEPADLMHIISKMHAVDQDENVLGPSDDEETAPEETESSEPEDAEEPPPAAAKSNGETKQVAV